MKNPPARSSYVDLIFETLEKLFSEALEQSPSGFSDAVGSRSIVR
jgi:hypothetical protein